MMMHTATFQVDAPSPDGLVTSVTTDQSTYSPGQPVTMNFSETNEGKEPVAVVEGPPSFQVSQNGTAVWMTPIQDYVNSPAPAWTLLQPGQTYSQTAVWDGTTNVGHASSYSGDFTVSNDLDLDDDLATFTFASPTASQLATSLTTNQATYQLGQPIQLSFTEKNVGTTPIQVLVGPSDFETTLNGAEVWNQSSPFYVYPIVDDLSFPDLDDHSFPDYNDHWTTLQPGQSVTQTATWNCIPDELPSGFSSGTFIVSNGLDPRAESTTFQIVA